MIKAELWDDGTLQIRAASEQMKVHTSRWQDQSIWIQSMITEKPLHLSLALIFSLWFKTVVCLTKREVIALYVDVHHVFKSSNPHQVIWDVLRKPVPTCKTKRCWIDQRQDLHINIHNTGWINGPRGLFLSLLSSLRITHKKPDWCCYSCCISARGDLTKICASLQPLACTRLQIAIVKRKTCPLWDQPWTGTLLNSSCLNPDRCLNHTSLNRHFQTFFFSNFDIFHMTEPADTECFIHTNSCFILVIARPHHLTKNHFTWC